jgi:hypothetical protein
MDDIISVLGVLTAISTYFLSTLTTEFEKINKNQLRKELKRKIRNVGLKFLFIVFVMNTLLLFVTSDTLLKSGLNKMVDTNTVYPFVLILDCYILILCLISLFQLKDIIKAYKEK